MMSRAATVPYFPSASLPLRSFCRCRIATDYPTATSRRFLSSGKVVLLSAMSSDAMTAPSQEAMSTIGQPAGMESEFISGQNGEAVGSVKQQLSKLFKASLQATFPNEVDIEPLVSVSTKFADYQCNNAMGLWSRIKGKSTEFSNPNSIGQSIAKSLPPSEMIESTSVAKAGFINITLSNVWIAKYIENMLSNGIRTWAPIIPVKRAVVDFSSPNIAKEMHVGHLRSTIIGDTLSRMLEFSNVEVLRRNHVGDWGTQFGMLIEYLFEMFPNWEDAGQQAIGDLQEFYKSSKKKFDEDASFKERAQRAVVQLQGGEEKYRNAWKQICEISRREFAQVYQRLGIQLEEKVFWLFDGLTLFLEGDLEKASIS